MISIAKTHKDVPIQSLDSARARVQLGTLVMGAIVNPFGPTLFGAVFDLGTDHGEQYDLYRISLNPFDQACTLIGEVDLEAKPDGSDYERLWQVFDSFGCPTLALAMRDLDAGWVFVQGWLGSFPNVAETWSKIEEYYGDPWSRIQSEVEGGMEDLQSLFRAESAPSTRAQHKFWQMSSAGDAAKEIMAAMHLAKANADKAHLLPEIQAFLHAWNGSIDHLKTVGNHQMADRAMAADEMWKWFKVMIASCETPPDLWAQR